jgi:hypothetical protein
MDVVVAQDVATQAQDKGNDSALRPGGVLRQMLLRDNAPDGLSFKFFRSRYQPGDKAFTSPRHHHAFSSCGGPSPARLTTALTSTSVLARWPTSPAARTTARR